MNITNRFMAVFSVALMATAGYSWGQELKDPYTRDDDLSGTTVEYSVEVTPGGFYKYTYDLDAPETNTGRVLAFSMDLSCDATPPDNGFNASDFPFHKAAIRSENGKYVPAAISKPYGKVATASLTVDNVLQWGVSLDPGESTGGLYLVSPYPPGDRTYRLIASDAYNWQEWDYSILDGTKEHPNLPWIDDWSVTGATIGPACPGEEDPDFDIEPTTFPGSIYSGEDEELNELLVYSNPVQDKLHVDAGTGSIDLEIHYNEDIDPKTFKVTPQRHALKQRFNPEPGSSETVTIPLDPGKNRIELQVKRSFSPPGKSGETGQDTAGRRGAENDKDVFVIRVDAPEGAPGKGKGKGEGSGGGKK